MVEKRLKKSKRDLLLDKIIDQLMTSGISDLSLRELASQLDTSHRVLLYHFGSKEELISEVVQEVRHREKSHFTDSVVPNNQASTGQSLTAFYDHNVSDAMRPYFHLFYEVWGIAQANPADYEKFLDGIVSVWVDSLSDILLRAGYGYDDARIRATLVLASMRGLQLDIFTTGEKARADLAFACLVSLIEAEIAHNSARGDSPA
jgi:AcrR family transcriptional regulator